MKRISLLPAALLFMAASAIAQPYVGPANTTDPIDQLAGYSITPAADGYYFAWSENGRIHLARLDATLHNASASAPPIELPLYSATPTASSPAIATNGTSVLVTWVENVNGLPATTYVGVAADLSGVASTPRLLDFGVPAPHVQFVDGAYLVQSQWLYRIGNDFAIASSRPPLTPAAPVALNARGSLASISYTETILCWGYTNNPYCPHVRNYTISTEGFSLSASAKWTPFDGPAPAPPTVWPNGDAFLAVIPQSANTADVISFSGAGELAHWFLDGLTTDYSVAGNGSDVLVVSTSNPNAISPIVGTFLHADGTQTPRFTIGTGTKPSVVAASGGAFVVTNETDFSHPEISGRIVRVAPPRRRGAR